MASARFSWMITGWLGACAAAANGCAGATHFAGVDGGPAAGTRAGASSQATQQSTGPKVCDRDGGIADIQSKDYDRTCKVDSDCVAVAEGNVCLPCLRHCPGGVVAKSAVQQYTADLLKLVDQLDPDIVCFCPADFGCCIAGQCSTDVACGMPH